MEVFRGTGLLRANILNEIVSIVTYTQPTQLPPKDSCSIDRLIDQEETKDRYDTNKYKIYKPRLCDQSI